MGVKIGKANIGAATVAGALLGGPAGAAAGAAYDNKGGAKQIGKQIAGMNPYAKTQTNVPQADPNALTMLQAGPKFEEAGFNMNAVNTSNADEVRRNQAMVAARLQQQALGQGPSIAQQQMQAGQEAALLQNRAALASTRGGANPLAARSAIQANQAAQLGIAQQAGIARLQEQQQAAQQYSGLSSDMRMRDLAQEELKANQQNSFNNLRQQYMNQGLSAAQANQQAMLQFEQMKLGQATAQANANAQASKDQKSAIGGLINQGAGALMGSFGTKK